MTWNPTIAQLCKIAELRHARAPVETIARELHIEAEFYCVETAVHAGGFGGDCSVAEAGTDAGCTCRL
jgi:hypothetical protein